MNTFKRKALMSAVLGTLGAAGTAQAIYQDPNGLGMVLIYPYYTVQSSDGSNAWNTYISVVNTQTNVKIVKVRFREGKNSAEVLDFNLYLSPNDMWTGAIVPASSDAAAPGHLVTFDLSCTNPVIPTGGTDFRNFQYTGTAIDGLGTGLDRTREGYFEMIEMADLSPTVGLGTAAVHGHTSTADTAPSCTGLVGSSLTGTITASAGYTAPTGGLAGTGTLINVNSGRDTMYNANAFADWRTGIGAAFYQDIGQDTPNLNDTNPATSIVVSKSTIPAGTLQAYYSTWSATTVGGLTVSAGVQAASATMMHADVINEYVLDAATKSNTDWVVTMPTRHWFINATVAVAPFTNVLTASGACETISFNYFNREERVAAATGNDFSPLPPGATPNSLCWESTVLSIRNGAAHSPIDPAAPSLVLGSQNVTRVGLQSATLFPNGWADMHFQGVNASTTGLVSFGGGGSFIVPIVAGGVTVNLVNQTFHGLPVLGFMIRTFNNGTLTCGTATCQGNYGGSVQHNYINFISP